GEVGGHGRERCRDPAARGGGTRLRVAATHRNGRGGARGDPPPRMRAARLDLDRRAQPPHRSERALAALMRAGSIVEYWAHEACLVPIEDFRMYRWRMQQLAREHPWRGNVFEREPELTKQVLRELAERGPLGSRHFEGAGSGGMWNWKPAKVVLEALHSAGRVVIAGRDGFQRLYDLPERVLPPEALNGGTPSRDEFVRWATVRGVRARGALTDAAVAEMWRLRGGGAGVRPHADALVAEGLLRRLDVADGKPSVLVP